MSESPMVGARIPQDWQQLFQEIARAAGRFEASFVREASAQYLGQTNPGSVKLAIASLEDRVASLERKESRVGEVGGLK